MQKIKNLEETYDSCLAEGYIKNIVEINPEKAISLIDNAKTNISSAEIIIKAIDNQAKEWMNVYINYYDAIRMLAEALIIFDRIRIQNHQCLFAYICMKHPLLEFNWDFFEKIRTKRNGINYYGEHINCDDWKDIAVQMKLYISTLTKELENKLN